MLIHCIYASTSTSRFEEHEIPALLAQARANNTRLQITGVLLFIEGSFFQVLEGRAPEVSQLYERLLRDPRHCRVTQIIREPIAHREFSDWSMGFAHVTVTEAAHLMGANDFFTDASCLMRLGNGRAKKLLSAFRDGRWRKDNTGLFKTVGRGG